MITEIASQWLSYLCSAQPYGIVTTRQDKCDTRMSEGCEVPYNQGTKLMVIN